MATTLLSRLLGLRGQARALASTQPFAVQVDAFLDTTHLDGPRYYCLFRVPSLNSAWQEAGEAETPADALANLSAALVLVGCRLRRLESEFFPASTHMRRNFSQELPTISPQQLIHAYEAADTAAQLVHAQGRAYGAAPARRNDASTDAFRRKFHKFTR